MWFVLALGAFAIAVLCHIVTVRLPLPFSNVIRYVLVGGIVGGVLVLTLLVLYGVSGEAFAGAMMFAFLSELYIFFFTLVISSVSVTLMLHLRERPIDEAEVSRIYDSRGMVTFRLEQMMRNGFATEQNGQYALTPAGRSMVYWFVLLRQIFGHELASTRR
jgi:hypothetical protein